MNIFNGIIGVTLPRIWKLADKIVVQDLPPPYTITWSNIYPYLNLFRDKINFVGLLEDYNSIDRPLDRDLRDIDILFYVSAPSRDRINFFRTLYSYLFKKRNSLNYNIYVVEGNPSRKIIKKHGNLTHIGWASNPYELMRRSKIIVLRGGQTSILESIMLEIPMIVMPAVNQTEQNENARRVDELGIGKYVDYSTFLNDKSVLWEYVRDIFDNYHQYIDNLKIIRSELIKSGGIKKVVELIRELINYGEMVKL
jgi:UDP:flavonoid glycosyltransferase YjiC (YdhE family)